MGFDKVQLSRSQRPVLNNELIDQLLYPLGRVLALLGDPLLFFLVLYPLLLPLYDLREELLVACVLLSLDLHI